MKVRGKGNDTACARGTLYFPPGHGCVELALGLTEIKDGRYPIRSMTTGV